MINVKYFKVSERELGIEILNHRASFISVRVMDCLEATSRISGLSPGLIFSPKAMGFEGK